MACTINASAANGIVQTADGSGLLKVQSGGVTTNALAWVNFNGTNGASPVIRASYNVSSVTRNSTGYYTVVFSNQTSDANYSYVVSACGTYGANGVPAGMYLNSNGSTEVAPATTGFSFATFAQTFNQADFKYINIAIFGN